MLLAKVVVHLGENVPAPLIDPFDVLCDGRLPLFVHVENLIEHLVGLKSFQVNVKDILALVWVEPDDLILEQRDLEEPLRYEIGGRIRGCTY